MLVFFLHSLFLSIYLALSPQVSIGTTPDASVHVSVQTDEKAKKAKKRREENGWYRLCLPFSPLIRLSLSLNRETEER
jgi:hypothetical protein